MRRGDGAVAALRSEMKGASKYDVLTRYPVPRNPDLASPQFAMDAEERLYEMEVAPPRLSRAGPQIVLEHRKWILRRSGFRLHIETPAASTPEWLSRVFIRSDVGAETIGLPTPVFR